VLERLKPGPIAPIFEVESRMSEQPVNFEAATSQQTDIPAHVHRSDPDIVKRLNVFASAAAILTMVIGLSALTGWTLHIAALLNWGSGTAMVPNTAACFVLAGLSLWLQRKEGSGPYSAARKPSAKAAAGIIILVASLTLAEQLFSWDPGIDRLLLLGPVFTQTAHARAIMSPITATAFLLIGFALTGIDWRTRRKVWVADLFCLGAAIATLWGLCCLSLTPVGSPFRVAIPTLIAFSAVTAGLLCSRATWALGGMLSRQSPEGRLLRGALPAALLGLPLGAWLISELLFAEVQFTWVKLSMLALLAGAAVAGFIGWTAFAVDRRDDEQEELEPVLTIGQEKRHRHVAQVEEPEANVRLQRQVKLSVAGAVLLTGFLGLLSWAMVGQAGKDAERVARTNAVSTALEITLRHLLDVETGARGFALTGEAPFLEPYDAGRYGVGADLERARTLIVDSAQQRLLGVLQGQAKTVLEASAALVTARRLSGHIETVAELEQGKRFMDAVRATVQEMESQEHELLERRTERAQATRQSTSSAVGLGLIFEFIFLSIAGITVSRQVGVSSRARKQIKALNADLERRVEQRTAALQSEVSVRKRAEEQSAQLAVELSQQAEEVVRSQQALEVHKLMLQSVLNSMGEGLIAADEQGKLILWNPAAGKIVGLGAASVSPEEWSAHYGAYLPDQVTPLPAEQNPLFRAVHGEVSTAEIFLHNPALERGIWIETNGTPLRDQHGVARGGVIAFRDITQRRADGLEIRKLNDELEDRIAKRTAQLEAANHELEAFSYSVSHDLRTPLRHIAGFSRILVNDFGPGMGVEARANLRHIEDAVGRLGLLVDALLGLARLGRQSLRLRHSELNPIVEEVISMLRPEYEGRAVEWRIAKLPALDCDPILLGQVFQNLLGNALKYSRGRAKAVIEVGSIQRPGEAAIIFVRDNGAGFDLKYAEKLFTVFKRFHAESEFEGTGVGLATVQRIIKKHGGMIWAEAEADHGATFYFALQTAEQIGTAPTATAAS
jgi:signal transduction histidine kinase/CHASE3 domain sensor protein